MNSFKQVKAYKNSGNMKGLRVAGLIFLAISIMLFSILLYEELVDNFNYYVHNQFNFFFLFVVGTFLLIMCLGILWTEEPKKQPLPKIKNDNLSISNVTFNILRLASYSTSEKLWENN